MQRCRSPLTSHSTGEVGKTCEHNHVLLKLPDEERMRDDSLTEARLIEQDHHPVSMPLNLLRNLFSHEGTFRIPPQQHLIVPFIPHQRQGIELTIERALLVDAAG
jgi:hypothetical protein